MLNLKFGKNRALPQNILFIVHFLTYHSTAYNHALLTVIVNEDNITLLFGYLSL
jgi:hypothetical protein